MSEEIEYYKRKIRKLEIQIKELEAEIRRLKSRTRNPDIFPRFPPDSKFPVFNQFKSWG